MAIDMKNVQNDDQKLDILFDFLKHQKVKFDKNCNTHTSYTIGCRSTYILPPNVFDFLHEVAHLIQLSDDEVITHYVNYNGVLNFNTPMELVINTMVCEPKTDNISMRELETFYIQYLLEINILGDDISFYEWLEKNEVIDLFKWLPDSFIFGNKLTEDILVEKSKTFINDLTFDYLINRWQNLLT